MPLTSFKGYFFDGCLRLSMSTLAADVTLLGQVLHCFSIAEQGGHAPAGSSFWRNSMRGVQITPWQQHNFSCGWCTAAFFCNPRGKQEPVEVQCHVHKTHALHVHMTRTTRRNMVNHREAAGGGTHWPALQHSRRACSAWKTACPCWPT